MKIAVWHNLTTGGSVRALHDHIKGLAARGHWLELWTNPGTDLACLNVGSYIKKVHVVPLERQEKPSFWGKVASFFFEPDFNIKAMQEHSRTCAAQIGAGGFDVLFANTCQHFAVPFISQYATVPCAVYLGEPYRTFYEAMPVQKWEALAPFSEKGRHKYYLKWFFEDLWAERARRVQVRHERLNYEAFGKVLVNSVFSSESCVRAYGTAPELCYLGINTQFFRPLYLPREPFVLGIGNFYINKNPEFALRAVAQIDARIRPKLIWVANMSDPNLVAAAKALAQELGVVFELKEMISDDAILQLLNRASVFVYSSRLEPFGYAPLEANACGLPVVAIAEGGVRETIVHNYNGLLVSNRTDLMAKAVSQLIEDQGLWDKISKNAIYHVGNQWQMAAGIDRLEMALAETSQKHIPSQIHANS